MDKAEKIMNLAIRRGFFWPAYEIYGGVSGFYVWGPLGVRLKRKVAELWREIFVESHGFLEIDGPMVAPYAVFKASGHVDNFKDIMVACKECGRKFRADTLLNERGIEVNEGLSLAEVSKIISENNVRCPMCDGELSEPTYFLTMFKTTIGPYVEAEGFLRPETAQNIFVEFKRIYESFRRIFPIGIAQIGRGFRNEISPRQGPIRLREFDMLEVEFFYDPLDKETVSKYLEEVMDDELNILHEELIKRGVKDHETLKVKDAIERGIIKNGYLAYFMALAARFLELLGIPRDKQRFKEKIGAERAHYSVQTFDQEVYLERWGWVEVSGHSNRTDYDLRSHIFSSNQDLYAYRELETPKEVKVIEVIPIPKAIKERYGERIGLIMSKLSSLDKEFIKDELLSKGYVEVEGVVLSRDLFEIKEISKQVSVEKFIPYVVEPSFGLDRLVYATMEYAYREKNDRIILSLPPYVAPYDVCVYPLLSKPELINFAKHVKTILETSGLSVLYDEKDSIGRRYARADEIGVPIAVTIDYQSLEDDTVTVRDRDTWIQYRIKKEALIEFIEKVLSGNDFNETAKLMKLELYHIE